MNFIIGFALALLGLAAASSHLQQGINSYWDFVAFAVVFCGTLAVLIMTRPKVSLNFLSRNFFEYLFGMKKKKVAFIKRCFTAVNAKQLPDADIKKIEEKLIVDGLEMIDLGFSREKIEEILLDRYFQYKKSISAISSWIKRCAKYPPAFGLGGTVLGLIHLMKGISSGADPKETGLRMAVALVATFYGLLLSNLVLNPASEAMNEKLKSDEELVEAAIKTIFLIKDESNLIEAQEVLNTYLNDEKEKLNFMNIAAGETFEAA